MCDLLVGLGIKAFILKKSNEIRTGRFDKKAYKERNMIERMWSRLKQLWWVARRYQKLTFHHLDVIKVAAAF